MADSAQPTTEGTAPVTDRRPTPQGVLPRRMQMWLMLGLAFGILAIIMLTGQTTPADRSASAAPTPQPLAMNADRLRDYQDRLRVIDDRARQEPVTQPLLANPSERVMYDVAPAATATPDPLEAERKRHAYESLFASNVVMSRRPDAQQLMNSRSPSRTVSAGPMNNLPAPPSLDEVAAAVMRASASYAPPTALALPANPSADAARDGGPNGLSQVGRTMNATPVATGPITSTGPLHRILEGTVIETVLTNRLDGGVAAPVNCLVSTPVYSHDGRYVLIPAGSRVLGETKPVQGMGDTRLAVAFDRLAFPDGRTYRLDSFMGLNDIGDAGLRDQVNRHYRSTFGASAAVGLLTGFAQSLTSFGLNRGNGGTVVIAGNVGDATAQATAQTMNRFLNRLPTVTIREGHRVKVYLTNDLELPAYDARSRDPRTLLAGIR
jgi:type IV secretory pathway VirB10-like protein